MLQHYNIYNIFNAEQFGFCPGHVTSHVTTLVVSNIADAFEKKLLTIGVFLDLSKAFDTIGHDILLYELIYYRIQETAFEWCSVAKTRTGSVIAR